MELTENKSANKHFTTPEAVIKACNTDTKRTSFNLQIKQENKTLQTEKNVSQHLDK